MKHSWNSRRKVWDEQHLTESLANSLRLELKRHQRGELTGRCEAISSWTDGYTGYQCSNAAKHIRDGRKVCTQHNRRVDNIFVGESAITPYHRFKALLIDLSAKDDEFRTMLKEAANEA